MVLIVLCREITFWCFSLGVEMESAPYFSSFRAELPGSGMLFFQVQLDQIRRQHR